MKNIIINSIILLFTITNIAQTVVPLETQYSTNFLVRDVYFKDINNELDKFLGTWKYENTMNNTVFEITFTKNENVSSIHNCTEDELTAEFKLTINGVEQYNTYTTSYGKTIIAGGFYVKHLYDSSDNVTELPVSINRYHLSIVEPNFLDDIDASDLTIEYENNLGIEKLNWSNEIDKSYDYVTGQQVNIYKMPLNMQLIKQ
ncbi:DUF6705 family protein [Olleya sp. HaHaR_3_96]|uniref:DUF6705 family protein n=1 Tax=Olleya sp. HaHaR_3_96 TaxID=2745560 RepID=UPI001C4E2E83|nr:DUF6705 family protein [Olleya sp. HaHaR_3_96]QXP60834.1 hypothetical protein H0I26_04135 [Olleya sp. HaHaR_3_96]